MKKESEMEILRKIRSGLPVYIPEIVHVDRLNSGTVRSGKAYIRMCLPGTPDLYAILSSRGGHVLFIEVKRPTKFVHSDVQKKFQHRIMGLEHVHYILAFSLWDVLKYIEEKSLTSEEG